MELTIKGSIEEIEQIFSSAALFAGSVPPERSAASSCEDRIYKKLEEKLREKEKEFCPSAPEQLREITPEAEDRKESKDSVHDLAAGGEQGLDRKLRIPHLPTKESLFIPEFEWLPECEKSYNSLQFCEHPDGRVMLSYMSSRRFTTRDRVLEIPYPIPKGYLKLLGAANIVAAVRQYRRYLAEKGISPDNSVLPGAKVPDREQDRNEEKDPDEPYKPKLKGAFSTRPGNEDIDKIEGTLE